MWLNEKGEIPELIKKCIDSQKQCAESFGYEHRLITLDNYYKGRYVEEVRYSNLGNGRWCKMTDWLRHYYLYTEGGVYLDSDVEVLEGKNFDAFLDNKMFLCQEGPYVAAAIIGAEKGHPLCCRHIGAVEDNFRGNGGWIWEPGMKFFNDMYNAHKNDPSLGIKVYPTEFFEPYDWKTKKLNITENTITNHHFMGSWTDWPPKEI